jgi:uncharacterized protein
MQINVAQLLKEPVGAKRSYYLDESTGENNEDHVEGEVTLTRTNKGILVTGKLNAYIQGTCSRCLGPACVRPVLDIEDEYYPVIDIYSGADVKLDTDALTIDHNHILDLDEAIRQYIITATPTKLLCKPDCPGICPVCGQEFAKGDCEHRNITYDDRWDKLVQVRKKESKI